MTDFVAFTGRDHQFSILLEQPDGTPLALPAGTAWRYVVRQGSAAPVIDVVPVVGSLSPARIDVAVLAAATNFAPGTYVAELRRTDTGADVQGRWTVEFLGEGLTQPGFSNVFVVRDRDVVLRVAGLTADAQVQREFKTRSHLRNSVVAASVLALSLLGCLSEGVGAAAYERMAVAPPIPNLTHVRSLDGAWWLLNEQEPRPDQVEGSVGWADETAARLVDDTPAIAALFSLWKTDPTVRPDFGGKFWGLSAEVVAEQVDTARAASFTAGSFVAVTGSTGTNMLRIKARYVRIFGTIGAVGTGGTSFVSRTWRNGILLDDCYRVQIDGWYSKNFRRDGFSIPQGSGVENNIGVIIGPGTAIDCGSNLRVTSGRLSFSFTSTVRTGNTGNLDQRDKCVMGVSPSADLTVDDLIYEPWTEVINFVGDGVKLGFQLSLDQPWDISRASVTVNGALLAYDNAPVPAPNTWQLSRTKKALLSTAPAVADAVVVTCQRFDAHVVTAIGAADITIFPWLRTGTSAGTLIYGFGSGIRVDGANTGMSRYGRVDGIRNAASVILSALYMGEWGVIGGQGSGCGIVMGNPISSAAYGGDLSSPHIEGTDFNLIGMSNVPYRTRIGPPSAWGAETSAASGNMYGQMVQLAPRNSVDNTFSALYSTFKGLDFGADFAPVTQRIGQSRGLQTATAIMSNLPHQCRLTHIRNSGNISLAFHADLDAGFDGYNTVEFTVFGSQSNGGPSGATTVILDADDASAGYTINGGASLVIPACTWPVHGVAIMDNAGASKNWRVRWEPIVGRNVLIGTVTANHAVIAAGARFSFTVSVPGAVLGDLVTSVSSSAALVGLEFSHAEVTAADTVTVTLFNPTGAAIDPANSNYRVDVRSAV